MRIAAWSTAVGLLVALALAALSGRLLLDQRSGDATALGGLGFSVAFLAPFGASLASFLIPSTERRRSIWLASGVLALCLGGLTIFSGVGLVFGGVGLGLLSAWWLARSRTGAFRPARSMVGTIWLLLWFGGAVAVLWLRETPACWGVGPNGSRWIAEVSPTSTLCISDVIDDTEGLLALVCVVIGFFGQAFMVRGDGIDGNTAPTVAPADPGAAW